MVMSSETSGRVLVRLTGISQELTVGVGAAIASVRTLTDFSLVVRARELVVLSGSSGAGERAVLAVIAGDRRGVSGSCEIADAVRIRALRISSSSALALAQEWQRAELDSTTDGGNQFCVSEVRTDDASTGTSSCSQLFLLDVVPDADDAATRNAARSTAGASGSWRSPRLARLKPRRPLPWNEQNRQALYDWAVVCQRRGGAIAMAVGEQFGLDLLNADPELRSRTSNGRQSLARVVPPVSLHASGESALRAPAVTSVRETPVIAPSLRVVAMHCGRLAASINVPYRRRIVAS